MFVVKSGFLLKMLRPERMTSTSIICVKKDVEAVLEALNSFGEFHIEDTAQDQKSLAEFNQNILRVQESLADVNGLTKQLVQEKTSLFAMFKVSEPTKIAVTADNWQTLLEQNSKNIAALKGETDSLNSSLSSLQEKTAQLNHIKEMLTHLESMGADFAAMEELKLIYVAFASVPAKNFGGLETALESMPVFVNRTTLTKESMFVALALPSKYHARHRQNPKNVSRGNLPHTTGPAA